MRHQKFAKRNSSTRKRRMNWIIGRIYKIYICYKNSMRKERMNGENPFVPLLITSLVMLFTLLFLYLLLPEKEELANLLLPCFLAKYRNISYFTFRAPSNESFCTSERYDRQIKTEVLFYFLFSFFFAFSFSIYFRNKNKFIQT